MSLRDAIIVTLSVRSAEPTAIARRLGLPLVEVMAELWALGDLVDFYEPPPPCGPENATWFIARPQAMAA